MRRRHAMPWLRGCCATACRPSYFPLRLRCAALAGRSLHPQSKGKRPIFAENLTRLESSVARTACRWHDPIHSQVLRDLAVVVEAMPRYCSGQAQARYLVFAKRTFHGPCQVLLVDGVDRLMNIDKRIGQVF